MTNAPAARRPDDVLMDPEDAGRDQHLEDGTDLGSIRIHNDVIAAIARQAALEVPGVADLSGGLVDGIAGMIGRRSVDRGIRVTLQENAVRLELNLVLEYGVRIPQVCWQIQNDLRETVENMTGKSVQAIDLVVQDIQMPSASDGAESAP